MDYAIAKFVALEEAGTTAADLRIVLMRDLARSEDHAIVAVRDDGEWLILDNRHLALASDAQTQRVEPFFILGQYDLHGLAPFAAQNQLAKAPGISPNRIAEIVANRRRAAP